MILPNLFKLHIPGKFRNNFVISNKDLTINEYSTNMDLFIGRSQTALA